MTDRHDDWLSLREVRRLLRVTPATASQVAKSGKIRSLVLPGQKRPRYSRADLEHYGELFSVHPGPNP